MSLQNAILRLSNYFLYIFQSLFIINIEFEYLHNSNKRDIYNQPVCRRDACVVRLNPKIGSTVLRS